MKRTSKFLVFFCLMLAVMVSAKGPSSSLVTLQESQVDRLILSGDESSVPEGNIHRLIISEDEEIFLAEKTQYKVVMDDGLKKVEIISGRNLTDAEIETLMAQGLISEDEPSFAPAASELDPS